MAADTPQSSDAPPQPTRSEDDRQSFFTSILVACLLFMVWQWQAPRWRSAPRDFQWGDTTPAPLVMRGGDPHLRALMRTISASESNDSRPYSILYGGEHVSDLSQHPDLCMPIVAGPNIGDCSTAAGRYQFLTSTWLEKASLYHPAPPGFRFWESYSFAPEYQDEVVYRWLDDPSAWGVDLKQLLADGNIDEVLQILSPVWTSLGYGIESNSMSEYLPEIYEQLLQEEQLNANL